jgi:alpha-galactosidase
MNSNDNRIKIAYIGGGSVNFGWKLLSEFAGEEISAEIRLYDADKQLALANEVIGNKMRENPDCKSDIIYLAVDTAEEALKNADFVILSFTQGTLEEMVSEMHLPETYGIYQSSGESTGPSGIMRALKTLPFYIKYGEMIKKLCPEAWVLNLTTPMAVCLMTLYRVFPEIKAFGSSNDIFQTQELLAAFAEKKYGVERIRRREIKTSIIGISNFSWINEASYNGNDLMPVFREFAEKYSESGFEIKPGEYKTNPYASANKIKFDLFLRYGMISAAPDRVVAEFCPPWYLKSPKTIASWKFSQTTVNYLKKTALEKMSRSKRMMLGEEQLKIGVGSDCVLQIKALLGMGNLITAVSLPNDGQVSNLPEGTITETNALISKNSVKAVASGKLPEGILGLTLRHISNQNEIVRSVFEKDLDIAFNAFLNDPLMSADLSSATELYKEMLSAIRNHLLYYC